MRDRMRVTVKTLEEIEKLAGLSFHPSESFLDLPEEDDGFSGFDPGFNSDMKKYCGKEICLDKWDGWRGFYDDFTWSRPMLRFMNRNGANS